MKHFYLFLIAGILGLFIAGCYTQLATTRDERPDDRDYTSADTDTTAVAPEEQGEYDQDGDYYANNDVYRPRVGFSYYYPSSYWPSSAFAVAYSNPWAYDCYWAYDPWICGTPYVNYYPYYGYAPYYGYYPGYYYGPHFGGNYYATVRHTRNFGNTRGTQGVRGSGSRDAGTGYTAPPVGNVDLPRSSRAVSPPAGPSAPRGTPTVSQPARTSGSTRGAYVPRTDGRSTNRQGVRSATPRGGSTRGSARQSRVTNAPSAPSAGTRAPAVDNGGTRTSSAPSSTPPPAQRAAPAPSRAPAPAAPAPASGGRGGDTRGRRP